MRKWHATAGPVGPFEESEIECERDVIDPACEGRNTHEPERVGVIGAREDELQLADVFKVVRDVRVRVLVERRVAQARRERGRARERRVAFVGGVQAAGSGYGGAVGLGALFSAAQAGRGIV